MSVAAFAGVDLRVGCKLPILRIASLCPKSRHWGVS